MSSKGTKIKIGGMMQKIQIVTRDESLPVLLFLHGGPGGVNRYEVLKNYPKLLDHFTLVGWDQRGSGGSAKGTNYQELTIDLMVEDAAQLVERLCKKFHKEKIFIACLSWGTVLGSFLVKKHPEHIAAYLGYGQVIDMSLNETLSYNWVVEQAEKAGDEEDIKAIRNVQPPVNGMYPGGLADLSIERDLLTKYGGASPNRHTASYYGNKLQEMKDSGLCSEADIRGYKDGADKTTAALWKELCAVSLPKRITKVEVPYFIFHGHQDMNTPWQLVEPWFNTLEAPQKELIWFEDSGHNPLRDEPEKFQKLLFEKLLPIAGQQ